MSSQPPWGELAHDPRVPEHAHLRASDRDRLVVEQVLAEGYADGRLDREELDHRVARLAATRTLGELPALVSDLVALPPPGPAGGLVLPAGRLTADEIHAKAVERQRAGERQALWTMLTATLICTVIWLVGGLGPEGLDPSFPWPLFVLLGTGLNYGHHVFDRKDDVREEERRLRRKEEKRAAKELERRADPAPEEGPATS